ncbi:MAG: hypothetical protein H0T47_19605 [Planctomycetaceae bacterium]|nr:hypothetical protein [Planctomycetaceae bacterium]
MATAKVEFGDFQTPLGLARHVCQVLRQTGVSGRSLVEPTCGIGNFLLAASEAFPESRGWGYEVNDRYVKMAAAAVAEGDSRVTVRQANFFNVDWKSEFSRLEEPILVVGNPPWVTNAAVGALGGANLPKKVNSQRLRGIEAITGKSNFDVSEWMLLALGDALIGREATLAVLVKEAVARKVLSRWWGRGDAISDARIYPIDALREFGASVAACLFVCRFHAAETSLECRAFSDLDGETPIRTIGYRDGRVVADTAAYDRWRHLTRSGSSSVAIGHQT